MYVQKHDNGNFDDTFSQTTRILSGHNTSLTKQRLKQVNLDQDDLLIKLKKKAHMLEIKSLSASRCFHSFVTNLEQQDMPDGATYRRLQHAITEARQSMHIHKMRPLQST